MTRRNHTVIPQPGAPKNRMALTLNPRLQFRINGLPHRLHDRRQLLRAHNADPGIRPREQEPRRIRTPAHPIIPRPKTAPGDDSELRYLRARDRRHEFRAVLRDAAVFGLGADHEARDILQEEEGNLPLRAELDEVRAFEGGSGEEDAVIGEDTDSVTVDAGES